jgi:hypothetical protein
MRFRPWFAGLLVTLVACAPPPKPGTPWTPNPAHATLPGSPDISREVMGWMVVREGERLAREIAPANDPHPVAAVFTALGFSPDLAEVVDLKRPMAIAIINPRLLASNNVQPYVAMVPVRSPASVLALFAAHHAALEQTPWGATVPVDGAKVSIGFVPGYAVVAWRSDLLLAGVRLLGPRLVSNADSAILVHLNFDNVRDAYGRQIETFFDPVARARVRDPQLAYAVRGLKQFARYLGSLSALELLCDLDSGGLTVTLRAEGKENGALAGYVQQQRPGPAWGIQYLPRDSVLAYATHSSDEGRQADIAESAEYFSALAPASRSPELGEDRERVKHVLERASLSTTGELAYAVWPGRSGGVGLGGAYRVNNAVAARTAIGEVYETLAPQIGTMLMGALGFDAAHLARYVHVERHQTHVAGAEADLLEVSVAWPHGHEAERKLFQSLFGKRLVLATAFVGDEALFTIGPDFNERLSEMIGTARGAPAASLGDEPAFAEALAYREATRVSFSYLATAPMARFSASLVQQTGELNRDEERALARFVNAVGQDAIVSTSNANGRRLEMTTHVPYTALSGAASFNGALWRIALSPLLNPPMMPPMPVPPAHVTPSLKSVTRGSL